MKWIISTVATIFFVPKLQPFVSDYIESDFINNIGIGGCSIHFDFVFDNTHW